MKRRLIGEFKALIHTLRHYFFVMQIQIAAYRSHFQIQQLVTKSVLTYRTVRKTVLGQLSQAKVI